MSLVPIGHRNHLPSAHFHLLLSVGSPPSKWMKQMISSFGVKGHVIGAGVKRKRRSLIITNDDYLIFSSIGTHTLSTRFEESGRYDMNSIISLGHGNFIPIDQVAIVIAVGKQMPSPISAMIEEKRFDNKVIDVTFGRATQSVVVTTKGFFILTSFLPRTIAKRFNDCVRDFKLFSVGNGHFVPTHLVHMVVSIDSPAKAPSRPNVKLMEEADEKRVLFRLNKGKKRKSLLILENGFVITTSEKAKVISEELDVFLY